MELLPVQHRPAVAAALCGICRPGHLGRPRARLRQATLLHALYQAIPLTADFGFNWDALEDALYGPEEPGAPPRVLIFRDIELLEERDPATARMFLDIVRTVAGNPASTLRGMVRARPSG